MTERLRVLTDGELADVARLCDMADLWPTEHAASRETVSDAVRRERKRRRDRPSTLRWGPRWMVSYTP